MSHDSMTALSNDSGSERVTRRSAAHDTPWLPLLSLLFGVLGVALSPLFGAGVLPSTAGLVAGQIARRRRTARRRQATLGVAVSAIGFVGSCVVGVIVLEPLIEQLLVTVGFLLP